MLVLKEKCGEMFTVPLPFEFILVGLYISHILKVSLPLLSFLFSQLVPCFYLLHDIDFRNEEEKCQMILSYTKP